MDVGAVRRYDVVPAAERVRLPHMRFHDLRHTFASLTLAAGFTAFEVSRWMGHASASTTTKMYGHLIPVDRSAQIDRFELYVAGG